LLECNPAIEGYSIFAVIGELPGCVAEEVLSVTPVDPAQAARSEPIREDQREDPDFARAVALSLAQVGRAFSIGGVLS
jgi:hypothetical protein